MNLKLSFKLKNNCFILWKEIFYEEKSENQRKQKLKEDLRDQYLYVKISQNLF